MSERIPEDVRLLIVERIDTVGQLEALLLIVNSEGRKWTADLLNTAIRSNKTISEKQLLHLHSVGLLFHNKAESIFWFPPADKLLSEAAIKLAELYPQYPHKFIELIYNKPSERIKTFVRSFNLTNKGNKDG